MLKRTLSMSTKFLIMIITLVVLSACLLVGYLTMVDFLKEIETTTDLAATTESIKGILLAMIFLTVSLFAFIAKTMYDIYIISREDHIAVEISKMTSNIDQQTTIDKLNFWNDRFVKMVANYSNSGKNQKLIINSLFHTYTIKSMKTESDFEKIKMYTAILLRAYAETYNLKEVYNERKIARISDASVMYDIGKLGTPGYILYKEANLSDEEMEMARRHANMGIQLARALNPELVKGSFENYLLEIAGYHHERYDGTGYPEGLKAEEIPIISRIIGVVTLYDTVTRDRPYKRAMTHEEAVVLINNEKGKYFDPKIVKIFNAVEREFKKIKYEK